MTDLPHTYTDADGDFMGVAPGCIFIVEGGVDSHRNAQVIAPQGETAVDLARAILAAAGATGHRIVHEDDLTGTDKAAVAMRERIAYLVEDSRDKDPAEVAKAIRNLAPSDGEGAPVFETPQELADHIARLLPDDRLRSVEKKVEFLDGVDARIIHRLARTEAEAREVHTAMEHLGREVEDLRAQMGNAQAADRGLAQALAEHVETHNERTTDVEGRLCSLEDERRRTGGAVYTMSEDG